LEFEIWAEIPKKMTHGNKSSDFLLCINDLHALMPIVKKLKMN
jgi:hypothetical protein